MEGWRYKQQELPPVDALRDIHRHVQTDTPRDAFTRQQSSRYSFNLTQQTDEKGWEIQGGVNRGVKSGSAFG